MELVARPASAKVEDNALLSAVRWLALLPPEWNPELKELTPAGTIVVHLSQHQAVTEEAARTSARIALQDPALQGWELIDCRVAA